VHIFKVNLEFPLYLSIRGVQNKCEIIYMMHMTEIITQIKEGARIKQETGLINRSDRLRPPV
jgi:hypothetical protein